MHFIAGIKDKYNKIAFIDLQMGNLQCFDFSFIKSRRVGSRVDSFDRRVTCE